MARAKNNQNGRIEEAIAILLQNQALLQQNISTLVQTQTAFVNRMSEADQRFAQIDSRFTQIDNRFAHIEVILGELMRMMERLPEAVRDKIGFKTVGQQTSQ
jgi:hypothetical protein